MAIESRLVSKTIENAQSRVEGYNFDIRKRVVEYDDVINKQRETIYSERDKVLRNEDLTETVRDFVDDEMDVLVGAAPGRRVVDDWDIDGLARARGAMGIEGDGHRRRGPGRAAAAARTSSSTLRRRRGPHARGARDGATARRSGRMVERLVLLRTIDALWVDHLTELDDFRRGVGLRGYARHGPAERVQARGVQALRGAAWVHPPPGRQHHLPGPGPAPGTAATAADAHAVAGRAGPEFAPLRPPRTATAATEPAPARSTTPLSTDAAAGSGAERAAPVAAATAAGQRATRAAGALLPGLGSRRPAQVRLQHGDEAVEGGLAPAHAAKLGRNEPCWCGSARSSRSATGPDARRWTGDAPPRRRGRRRAGN